MLESLGMDKGEAQAFLPHDLDVILKNLDTSSDASVSREVTIKNRVFSETVQLIPQFKVARIYAYEITERKRAEEALRESERKYSLLFSKAAIVASLTKLPEQVFVDVNEAFEKLFGYTREEAIGKTSLELGIAKPEERTATYTELERRGSHRDAEKHVFTKSGEERILVINVIALELGGQSYALTTMQDITERKRAEEALRRSEKQYRELFENMIEGYAYCKMVFENGKPQDFIYLSVNHAFETLTGLTNVVGKSVTEVIPGIREADRELLEIYGRVALTGKPERFEMFVEALKMWFSISVYSPEKEFFVAVFDVITERKKAEEAQGRLAAIVESAEDAIIGKDLNGIIQTWNVGAENIFGYKAEEVIGKTISLLVPPGHTDEVPEILARIKQGEHIENFETVRMRKDGTVIPVSLMFSAIKDASGKVIGASKIAHDITERKQAEEALRLSEEKFSLAFANNPAAIAMTRLEDGLFLDVNDTWLAMNGYSRDEVIGLSARRLPIWPTVEAGARFVQALREKGSLRGWEQEFRRKSGEVFVAQLSAQVLTVRGDKVVLSTLVDITERKRAEEALLRLNKALKALSDSSQAIIRATDEPEYLNDVCRIIVEDCGYSMAWIGFAENDEKKSVRPAAYAGFEDGYLETLKLTWADTERGRGPTGTAIRTGEVVVCRNMLTDPAFAPWREQAIKRGYASSIVFPIMTAGKTFGAITIYSREADPFSEGEIKLLTELADNLAHGIEVLRLRAAQKKAEEALRESEEQFRTSGRFHPQPCVVGKRRRLHHMVQPALVRVHRYDTEAYGRLGLAERT